MTTPIEYEDSAYDSTRPRELPLPMVDNERSVLARSWLKHKLEPLSVECGEFLCMSGSADMRLLRSGELDARVKKYPLKLFWSSFRNPFVWLDMFHGVAGFFALMSALGFVLFSLIALINGGENLWGLVYFDVVFGLVSAGIYYLFGQLMTLEKDPTDKSFVFDRCTGMVHLPLEGGRPTAIPFDEFAPYLHKVISPHGFTTYSLILGHQYSNLHLLHQGVHQTTQMVYLEWEFHRQFMDVSQPLPDIPALEPLRQYDPTTIEWDKRMGRPSDLWRNFSEVPYEDLPMLSEQAVKVFPWGAKRQQAIYGGWNPTCYSTMTWRGTPELKSNEEKTIQWQRCLNLVSDKVEREKTIREKRFERLISLIDATYDTRKMTLMMVKEMLEKDKLSSEVRQHQVSYVADTETSLSLLAASRNAFKNAGVNGTISGQDSDPVYLHGEWIKEIGNQATARQIMAEYEYPDSVERQRTEHVKINYESIVTAIDTLKLWESTPGEVVPQGIEDTVVAFLVDLVAEDCQLDDGEVTRLNRMLGQELSSEQYITRYAERLNNDQAITDFVSQLVLLQGYHGKLFSFVAKQMQLLIEDIVEADGVYNEYEWHRVSIYRESLGKALGVDFPPPQKPKEVMA